MRIIRCILIALSLMYTACGSDNRTPVPRRTAYPRPVQYPTHFARIDSLPVSVLTNSSAITKVEKKDDGNYWITIDYPEYKARIYCTLTPVDPFGMQQVIDNRMERIRLNVGDRTPATEEVDGQDGFSGALIATASVSATPLQFITVDTHNAKWVMTGVAFLDGITSTSKTDSIAPVVSTLRRDIKILLDSIGYQQ